MYLYTNTNVFVYKYKNKYMLYIQKYTQKYRSFRNNLDSIWYIRNSRWLILSQSDRRWDVLSVLFKFWAMIQISGQSWYHPDLSWWSHGILVSTKSSLSSLYLPGILSNTNLIYHIVVLWRLYLPGKFQHFSIICFSMTDTRWFPNEQTLMNIGIVIFVVVELFCIYLRNPHGKMRLITPIWYHIFIHWCLYLPCKRAPPLLRAPPYCTRHQIAHIW